MKLFSDAAEAVYPESPFAEPDHKKLIRFMELGFAVIEQDCALYLNGKADRQRDIGVIRDSFGPVTALVAGIIGLTASDGSVNSDYLTGLGLATTAANEGFKIYEQQYLFGAENVGAVERLIVNALRTDAAAKLSEEKTRITWASSVAHLRTNQEICDPHQIRDLVRGAIGNGKLEAIHTQAPSSTSASNAGGDGGNGGNSAKDSSEEEKAAGTSDPGIPAGVRIVPN